MSAHPPTSRQLARSAVLAPALLCAAMSAYVALRIPVFFGADERAHLLYTASIIDGRLPEFRNDHGANARVPIVAHSMHLPAPPPRMGVWEAYHPPLAYVVSAPVVWAAAEWGPEKAPALAMRLTNVAGMAAGVAFAGLFAQEAFPRRRGIGFAAACLTAVVPMLVAVAASGQNDGVAFALSTACLWIAARLLRRGPSPGLLVAACAVASVGMLARISVAPMAALVVAAAALAEWRDRDRPWRVGRALGAAAAVVASTLVVAGWFYWRNHELYGSFISVGPVPELHRVDPGTPLDVLTSMRFHRTMWPGLYGSVSQFLRIRDSLRLVQALAAVLVAGLALAGVRRLRRGRPPATAAERDGIGPVGWALVLAATAGIVVSAAWHVSHGGGIMSRYLLELVPVVSALLARAIAELPAPRLVFAAVAGGLGAVLVSLVSRYQSYIDMPRHPHPYPDPAVGPSARLVLIGGVVVATAICVWVGIRLGPIGANDEPEPPAEVRAPEMALSA